MKLHILLRAIAEEAIMRTAENIDWLHVDFQKSSQCDEN